MRKNIKKKKSDLDTPNPPQKPLSRVIIEGYGNFRNNCGSTSSRNGFLGLFGEMLCHNQECPNSKSNKMDKK